MKLQEAIKDLSDVGLTVAFGNHTFLNGYWCSVSDHPELEDGSGMEPVGGTWEGTGHGDTIKEALGSALKVRSGRQPPSTDTFEKV
jgi:hypothetical protein